MRYTIFILTAILFLSCAKKIYIPTDVVKTEYRDRQRIDSVYIEKTVHIYSKGDTIHKDSITSFYKGQILRDTITITDSIPYPVKVPEPYKVEVEKKVIPKWCWWNLGISGLFVSLFLMWLIWKIKK